MRISDWSSDVCSSDLFGESGERFRLHVSTPLPTGHGCLADAVLLAEHRLIGSVALTQQFSVRSDDLIHTRRSDAHMGYSYPLMNTPVHTDIRIRIRSTRDRYSHCKKEDLGFENSTRSKARRRPD